MQFYDFHTRMIPLVLILNELFSFSPLLVDVGYWGGSFTS